MVVKEALHDIPQESFLNSARTDLRCIQRLGELWPKEQELLERFAPALAQLGDQVRLAEIREANDNFSETALHLSVGAKRFGFSLAMWYVRMISIAGKLDADEQKAWDWLRALEQDQIRYAAENYMVIDYAARAEIHATEMPLTPEIEDVRWDLPALAGFSKVLRNKLKNNRQANAEEIRDVSHGAMIGAVILNSVLPNQDDKLAAHLAG